MLAELISALPDEQAYLELLSKYKKLLMKYARMLNYEDSLVLQQKTDKFAASVFMSVCTGTAPEYGSI